MRDRLTSSFAFCRAGDGHWTECLDDVAGGMSGATETDVKGLNVEPLALGTEFKVWAAAGVI